ncbi:MAG: hypothetical protein AAF677_18675 [Pseudomonadota bacterium]
MRSALSRRGRGAGGLAVLAGLAAALLVAALPGAAAGGAWTKKAGDGVVISSFGRQGSPTTMFTLAPTSDDKTLAQIYAEYGLTDAITVGGSLYSETELDDDADATLLAAAFLRHRLWQSDRGYVASVQIGGALPLEGVIGAPFAESTPDSVAEVRVSALGGVSWWGDWGSAFVSGTVGFAWRSENAADEIRGELTAGYKPHDCCMAILSLYAAQPLLDDDTSLKIAPSFAYSLPADAPLDDEGKPARRRTTLQIGLSHDVLDGSGDLGVTVAIWRAF